MRWFRLKPVKWWSSTAAVVGVQQQKYRLNVVETAHCHPQTAQDPAEQEQPAQDPESDIERKVDAICNQYLRHFAYSVGFAVSVSVDGEMKYRKAFGMKDFENGVRADVEDFTAQIWSCTKPFTAHCWAKCFEDIDDVGVRDILTDFPNKVYIQKTDSIKELERYRPETIEGDEIAPSNLLTHTLGVIDNQTHLLGEFDDFTLYRSSGEFMQKYRTVCQVFSNPSLRSWHYSNFGYDLVAVMLERVQDKNFRDHSSEQLVSLGMIDTCHYCFEQVHMSEAFWGYSKAPWADEVDTLEVGRGTNPTVYAGSASLISNVDDLNKFGNITARMYKRVFFDELDKGDDDIPLRKTAVESQYDALVPKYFDKMIGKWLDQNAGWNVGREMESNVAGDRRVNVTLDHAGAGLGCRAFLSIGFHHVRVPERLDEANATRRQRDVHALKTREFDPVNFAEARVLLRTDPPRPVPDSWWITRWELPAEVQVLWSESAWDYYANTFVRATNRAVWKDAQTYHTNARIYLLLITTVADPGFRANVHRRLDELVNAFKLLDANDNLKEHLMRKQILEHRRVCRNEDGSLSREDMEKFERICDAFEHEHFHSLANHFKRALDRFIRPVELAHNEFKYPQPNGYPMTRSLRVEELYAHLATFHITQPFNISNDLWNRESGTLWQMDYRDYRKFEHVELNDDEECQCTKYVNLTDWFGGEAFFFSHFYNLDNLYASEEQPLLKVPDSWLPRDTDSSCGVSTRNEGASSSEPSNSVDDKPPRSVVVSIIANSRQFKLNSMGQDLDNIFTQHYDS